MLVQDHLTGQLHEVSDEGVAYDGFGNPVGFPPLLPILTSLAPMVLPAVGNILKSFTGGGQQGMAGYASPEYGDDELSEVPQGEVVYDGFGNPVGFAPLLNIAKSVLPGVARAIGPIAQTVGRMVQGGPAGLLNAVNPLAQMTGQAITNVPGLINQAAAAIPTQPMPRPYPFPLRIPPGWQRAPVPYTGAQPARAYMRCSVWRGPQGLTPVAAGTMPNAPYPYVPGTVPPAPAAAAPVLRRRRRRR